MRHDKLNPGIVFGFIVYGRNINGDDGEYIPPPEPVWNISTAPGVTRVRSYLRPPSRPLVTAEDGQATVRN